MKMQPAYRIQVAAVVIIITVGLLLTAGLLYAGANQAAGLLATPIPPVADGEIVLPAHAISVTNYQDARTLVLEPTIQDIVSDTWPVRQDDVYVNPPSDVNISLPTDVWDLSYAAPGGSISQTGNYILHVFSVGPQGLVTVTYHTRSRVVRSGNLVTVTARAPTNGTIINPFTCTIVYTRYFPADAPGNYWGEANPQLEVEQISPETDDKQPGYVRWITATGPFTGMVVLSEPMFGSDITITDFLMVPAYPVYGQNVNFTVTVKNIGVMTAWRGFASEVYLKPTSDPPPANAFDHNWGIVLYQGDALFHKPGFPGDWPVNYLGPGDSVTLTTGITLLGGSAAGSLTAYAQADTGYNGDVFRYAWYGSNIEGYGVPPYPEEKNVRSISYAIYISDTHWLQVSPPAYTQTAAPGNLANYVLQVYNAGNVTDTYDILSMGNNWTVTIPITGVGPLAASYSSAFSVTVQVSDKANTGDADLALITVRSRGDPTQTSTARLTTVAGKQHLYLPIVLKQRG